MKKIKKKILFVCTGNYYRSKFAELYFNHIAAKNNLNWRSFSSGFNIENPNNVGRISPFVIRALTALQIPITKQRDPTAVKLDELQQANVIIALNQTEHEPFVKKYFPDWTAKFRYWHISDVQQNLPLLMLTKLQKNIDKLITDLKR